jgi:hypothetical protein
MQRARPGGWRSARTAQLIDAGSDAYLWAASLDRELVDVFAVQEEIAREVARALEVRLGGAGGAVATRATRATRDREAYEHYLRGRYVWHLRTADGHRQAERSFRLALARDSAYADAWAGLADTYFTGYALNHFGFVHPESTTFARMRHAAERAVALDDGSAARAAAHGRVSDTSSTRPPPPGPVSSTVPRCGQ